MMIIYAIHFIQILRIELIKRFKDTCKYKQYNAEKNHNTAMLATFILT